MNTLGDANVLVVWLSLVSVAGVLTIASVWNQTLRQNALSAMLQTVYLMILLSVGLIGVVVYMYAHTVGDQRYPYGLAPTNTEIIWGFALIGLHVINVGWMLYVREHFRLQRQHSVC